MFVSEPDREFLVASGLAARWNAPRNGSSSLNAPTRTAPRSCSTDRRRLLRMVPGSGHHTRPSRPEETVPTRTTRPAWRHAHARTDAGLTLVEMMVGLAIIVIIMTSALLVFTHGIKATTRQEMDDRSIAFAQEVLSKARQVSFADLGYYDGDPDAPARGSLITLPVTDHSTPKTEQAVSLGDPGTPRPHGTAPFMKPLDRQVLRATNGNGTAACTKDQTGCVTYRIATYVTNPMRTKPGDVAPATAKRVTVQVQRAPGANRTDLTGDCRVTPDSTCITESTLRAATASDYDKVSQDTPQPACVPGRRTSSARRTSAPVGCWTAPRWCPRSPCPSRPPPSTCTCTPPTPPTPSPRYGGGRTRTARSSSPSRSR